MTMQQLQGSFQNNVFSVHFLSIADQKQWENENTLAAKFVKAVPYGHPSRKNLGYLYAISHGARFLFDFDDNVLLMRNASGAILDPIDENPSTSVAMPMLARNVFNYHALMNASVPTSWPRGFPGDYTNDTATHGSVAYTTRGLDLSKVGIMLICANGDPVRTSAVDAVDNSSDKLAQHHGVTFDTDQALLVPSHVFTPYNAQTTVHLTKALWATLLPASVPNQVSDIWRAYMAQAIFRYVDQQVAVLPPRLKRIRSTHALNTELDTIKDPELDMMVLKTSKLVRFLTTWSSDGQTVPELMEQLWIELYEHNFISEDDIYLVQLWLKALVISGYDFPPVRKTRLPGLVVMGQFNYATAGSSVVWWVQKWRQLVDKVVVRGPWTPTQLSDMRDLGIICFYGRDDAGFVSPVENLLRTLEDFQDDDDGTGVLYIHDDALVNINHLMAEHAFPSQDTIIASQRSHEAHEDIYFQDLRQADATTKWPASRESAYFILPDGTFRDLDGANFSSWQDLESHSLRKWSHWGKCIPQATNVAADNRSLTFKDNKDGSTLMPTFSQSDFLYIPRKHAKDFIEVARPFVEHNVFLECGVPAIVDILRHFKNVSVATTELCSAWGGGRRARGSIEMVTYCLKPGEHYGVFHPFKISQHGLKGWGDMFDLVSLHSSK